MNIKPVAAELIAPPDSVSIYPEPFASMMHGRVKRKLGDYFGLTNFGVNQTTLAPGAISALLHCHMKQDELMYILQGTATLLLNGEEYLMNAGDCIGIKAGSGMAAQLMNRSVKPVVYIEIGDRTSGDTVDYPDDDIKAVQGDSGAWVFTHKDGRPY